MSLSENQLFIEQHFNYTKINDRNYIIYSNNFYFNTDINLPLSIELADMDTCVLRDLGDFCEKCEELDVNFNFDSSKTKLLLEKYEAKVIDAQIIMECGIDELLIKVSNYFALLSILYNEVC